MKQLYSYGAAALLVVGLASCTTNTQTDSSASGNLDSNPQTTMSGSQSSLTGTVVLDLNHPLAGKALNFEVEVVEISKSASGTLTDTVENGDTIKVDYVGTFDDGEVFDSSRTEGREPLEFTVGAQKVVPGFDAGVLEMKLGETKTLNLTPADAYGEYDEAAIQEVPASELESFVNAGYKLEAGETLPTQFGPILIKEVK